MAYTRRKSLTIHVHWPLPFVVVVVVQGGVDVPGVVQDAADPDVRDAAGVLDAGPDGVVQDDVVRGAAVQGVGQAAVLDADRDVVLDAVLGVNLDVVLDDPGAVRDAVVLDVVDRASVQDVSVAVLTSPVDVRDQDVLDAVVVLDAGVVRDVVVQVVAVD